MLLPSDDIEAEVVPTKWWHFWTYHTFWERWIKISVSEDDMEDAPFFLIDESRAIEGGSSNHIEFYWYEDEYIHCQLIVKALDCDGATFSRDHYVARVSELTKVPIATGELEGEFTPEWTLADSDCGDSSAEAAGY